MKKWIIFGIAVILIVVGVIVIATSQKSEGEKWAEYTEETEEYVNIFGQYKVSPTVPPEIAKIVEVEYEVDEEALKSGSLVVRITARNSSEDQVIKRAHVSLTIVDDKGNALRKGDAAIGFLIPPGEKANYPVKLGPVFLDDLESKAAGFIVTLEQVDLGEPSVSPTPSLVPPPSPVSPKEVVDAFFEALRKSKYLEAQQYLSSRSLTQYLEYLNESLGKEYASLEEAWKDNPGQIPQRVEILDEKINKQENTASVLTNLSLLSGQTIQDWDFDLIRENDIWKLVLP